MMDSTCLEEMMSYRIAGREEDIIRSIAKEKGADMELVENAINLMNNAETELNVAVALEKLKSILIDK